MTDPVQIGRLAFRHEGEVWNAYYAEPDTMEGAILLGSIIIVAIVDDPKRKQLFMDLMKLLVDDIIKEVIGVRPDWPNEPGAAPEHERAGHS